MKLRIATGVIAAALWTAPAWSQGCAMCYQSAKGASTDGQRAIAKAVAVLLLPTVTLIGGMAAITYKFRKPRD